MSALLGVVGEGVAAAIVTKRRADAFMQTAASSFETVWGTGHSANEGRCL